MNNIDWLKNKRVQLLALVVFIIWSYIFRQHIYYLIVWNPVWIYSTLFISIFSGLAWAKYDHLKYYGRIFLWLFLFILFIKLSMLVVGIRFSGNLILLFLYPLVSLFGFLTLAWLIRRSTNDFLEKLGILVSSSILIVYLFKTHISAGV